MLPTWLNGMTFKSLEFEDQAYVRKLMRVGLARIVDRRVQIRNESDAGYAVSYVDAMAHARAIRLMKEV